MTDTARVLLTAAILSASALGAFAWRLTRLEASSPERLVGELRLTQIAAVLLALAGGLTTGLAVANESVPTAQLEATLGAVFVVAAGLVLRLETSGGLLAASAAFVLHSLVNVAHRPGLLSPDLGPRWFLVGSATYDVFVAAVCFWARRR